MQPQLIQCRDAKNTRLNFNGPSGPPDFVPVVWVPVTLAAGDILDIKGQCVLSGRGDGDYPGFSPEYFSATALVIGGFQPGAKIDINKVVWIDKQDGADAWLSGGVFSATTNPYAAHYKGACFRASGSGLRYVSLLAWVTSYSASTSDWINSVSSECYLDVLKFPAAG